jgi:predicted enzyme related to lactoylglutathione lyase
MGHIVWTDLTVADADGIRDFYSAVVGWEPEAVSMGDYSDYTMKSPETGDAVSGICHARGVNAALPPTWLVYVTVEDVDRSAATCAEMGGEVLVEPRGMGAMGRYCLIRDPAGAVCALFAPAA